MRQELFSDIDPPIKLALQTRKKRFTGKRDIREYSKSAFVRVWPVSIAELGAKDFPKLNKDTIPSQETATHERYIFGMQPYEIPKDPLSSYTTKYSAKDKKGKKYTYGYNRPKPGITGLSVQYEGFSGKGLVKMQLKGVINTLEDLNIYNPILFTIGKYWMLGRGFD